jgi:hypothetical protein
MTMPEDNDTQSRPNLSSEPGDKSGLAGGTQQQPAPNLSTEHQREGDARFPSDTLDRGQPDDGSDSVEPGKIPGSAEDIEIEGVGSTSGPSG